MTRWPELDAGYSLAQARWPNVVVARAAFLEAAEVRSPTASGELAWEDLYLVVGAAAGQPAALAEVDRAVEAQRGALLHLGLDFDTASDLLQQLRGWLLIPRDGPLRLLSFAAAGPLRAWLRTVAVRQGLRVRRSQGPSTQTVGKLDAAVGQSPELAAMRGELREAFNEALRQALTGLTERERTVLRQYHLDHLTIDQLGAMHGVHRATAARWVAAAQRAVMSSVRRLMLAQRQLGRSELNSALRLMRSQLDLSLSALTP